MEEYQAIIFFDEQLVLESKKKNKKKLILNYRTGNLPFFMNGIKINELENTFYYEINIEACLKIIKKHQEHNCNTIGRFCLEFLKCLLEDSSDSLLCFLQKYSFMDRKDFFQVNLDFKNIKRKKKYKNAK